MWARNFDEITISQITTSRFDGLFASHSHGFAQLDLTEGSLRVLLDAKGILAWPMSIRDRVICVWQDRGQLHTAWLDQKSGRLLARHSQPCLKPNWLQVHPLRDTAIVQLSQRNYMMLDDHARPIWQVQLPHWFRSLHEYPKNLLRFGLSSNIVDVARSTGRIRRSLVRPLEVTRKALLGHT